MKYAAPINLVFMLEEESAKHLLKELLPRILSESQSETQTVTYKLIPHQGKGDLQKSIPIKLKAWLTPNTFFIILHDQDSHDCRKLKHKLKQLCVQNNKHKPLIRIVCQELEAWYFGDLDAVEKAFPSFRANKYKNKRRFKNPDAINKPSDELKLIVRGFNKGIAAREVPRHMNIDMNTSTSFNHLICGLQNLVKEQLSANSG